MLRTVEGVINLLSDEPITVGKEDQTMLSVDWALCC